VFGDRTVVGDEVFGDGSLATDEDLNNCSQGTPNKKALNKHSLGAPYVKDLNKLLGVPNYCSQGGSQSQQVQRGY
jgi:hypothetical protein